jgi:hypothetical protein
MSGVNFIPVFVIGAGLLLWYCIIRVAVKIVRFLVRR